MVHQTSESTRIQSKHPIERVLTQLVSDFGDLLGSVSIVFKAQRKVYPVYLLSDIAKHFPQSGQLTLFELDPFLDPRLLIFLSLFEVCP